MRRLLRRPAQSRPHRPASRPLRAGVPAPPGQSATDRAEVQPAGAGSAFIPRNIARPIVARSIVVCAAPDPRGPPRPEWPIAWRSRADPGTGGMPARSGARRRPIARSGTDDMQRPPPDRTGGGLPCHRHGGQKTRRAYQSSRTTMRVLIGSFIAARRRASRATSSLTPSISNITRPGLTLAAQ